MSGIDELIERARIETAGELRAYLLAQPTEWLVDQLVDRVMAGIGPHEPVAHQVKSADLDDRELAEAIAGFLEMDRDLLESTGHLLDPPAKGGPVIRADQRTEAGEKLLRAAKNLLHTLVTDHRGDEEFTLTVPRSKVGVFDFLNRAATEMGDGNVVVRVEYGEVASELVGDGIVAALRVINDLELNEQGPLI